MCIYVCVSMYKYLYILYMRECICLFGCVCAYLCACLSVTVSSSLCMRVPLGNIKYVYIALLPNRMAQTACLPPLLFFTRSAKTNEGLSVPVSRTCAPELLCPDGSIIEKIRTKHISQKSTATKLSSWVLNSYQLDSITPQL